MLTMKYWQNLESMMEKEKQKISKQCRIGDTCFTPLATIWGNLFTRHLKNHNYVHKDSNNILSVIIILGTNVHGGETVFNDGENINDIVKIAHIMKHSHGSCVVVPFDKIIHEGSIWTCHRALISFILHKSILFLFVHHGTIFYDKNITSAEQACLE